jgi:hypothetical protein
MPVVTVKDFYYALNSANIIQPNLQSEILNALISLNEENQDVIVLVKLV